jgi:hypothetical protein
VHCPAVEWLLPLLLLLLRVQAPLCVLVGGTVEHPWRLLLNVTSDNRLV